MRIGRFHLGPPTGNAVTWIRGRWCRRRWWRLWVEEPQYRVPFATTLWLIRHTARLLARFVLHEGGAIAAAEAMRTLNRYASARSRISRVAFATVTILLRALICLPPPLHRTKSR